ncbi:MMPL family transporter [Nocardiopsis potens]|uniref:MMPL family transporter n=1 Tax=Nocardiopsis potens TaxID=1246458 RepID=UPI000348B262|nr:MMPL family transporter [Nocardiopsis potens]
MPFRPGRPPHPPHRTALWRLGAFAARRRAAVAALSALFFLVAVGYGAGALNALSLSRLEGPPGSESAQAREVLAEEFGTGAPSVTLLVTADDGDVDSPASSAAGRALTEELAAFPGVAEAHSYWDSASSPALRGEDGSQALVLGFIPGDADRTRGVLAELHAEFDRAEDGLTVRVTGREEVFRQIGEESSRDFVRAEALVFPGVFVLLLLLLRRPWAAALPMAAGLAAIAGTLAALRAAALAAEVSTFALNLVLVLGIGLGVDYGLIMVSRFREERRRGRPVPEAVAATTATAGRTVVFSGVTVLASLAALLVFPMPFMRSFAYGGVAVVLFGVLAALVLLPALLALAGDRVLRREPAGRAADRAADRGGRFWHGLAVRVMRRPVLLGGTALAVLLVLGSPFLDARFGPSDERILPPGSAVRAAEDELRAGFGTEAPDALQVVATGAEPAPEQVAAYAADLSRVPGIAQVDSPAGRYEGGERTGPGTPERFTGDGSVRFSAVPTEERMDAGSESLVREVRAVDAPFGTAVGGTPAEFLDYRDAVVDGLPLALALVFAATVTVLFLLSGSVLLPLKATALNLLSLSVMFGALVWVFQEGNLSGALGFTPTGFLDTSIPVLMFCIVYGLSMDYEVFIMARMKEEYDRTGDNAAAVAAGLERTGPLVTAAAAILALSFAAYATSGVVFLKMLGVGTALVVIADATLVRGLLVPSLMRLAGRANWWAPGPLRALHRRFGLREEPADPAPPPGPVGAAEERPRTGARR